MNQGWRVRVPPLHLGSPTKKDNLRFPTYLALKPRDKQQTLIQFLVFH